MVNRYYGQVTVVWFDMIICFSSFNWHLDVCFFKIKLISMSLLGLPLLPDRNLYTDCFKLSHTVKPKIEAGSRIKNRVADTGRVSYRELRLTYLRHWFESIGVCPTHIYYTLRWRRLRCRLANVRTFKTVHCTSIIFKRTFASLHKTS